MFRKLKYFFGIFFIFPSFSPRSHYGGSIQQNLQKLYVEYFGRILGNWRITPTVKYISQIVLTGIPIISKNSVRPFIEIFQFYQNKLIKLYSDKKIHDQQRKYRDSGDREKDIIKIIVQTPVAVAGDILVRVNHNGKFSQIPFLKFGFNSAFISSEK